MPLIVAGPAVALPGREVTALVDSVDVFTSAADLAGVDARAVVPRWVDLDAVSFVPYLVDPAQGPLRSFSYTEQFNGDEWPRPNQNGHATVRNARYKLIQRYSGGGSEFFDLQADPFENSDLLARSMTIAEQQELASLRAVISSLRGQPARFEPFGAAQCVGSNGLAPLQTMAGLPRLGQTYTSQLHSATPARQAFFLVGFSNEEWNGLPLPIDLGLVGAGAGCELLVAGDATVPDATDGSGSASAAVSIPFRYELVGLVVFHQWLVADAAAPGNRLGVVSAPAVAALVGP